MTMHRKSSRSKVRSVSDLLWLVLFGLVAWPAPIVSQVQTGERPIDHDRAASFFREARALEGENPWGATLYGPILFVEPESRYVVANQADAEAHLTEAGDVFVGVLPEGVGIANTATSWAGTTWTMVLWPLPNGYFERRRLVGHELFHRLGPDIGLPMASPPNAHLDTAVGRTWFRMELRALIRALANTGDARNVAVEDALSFRARRRSEFPGAAAEEAALERNEGLAEYTGMRVSLPAGARTGWAVQRLEAAEVQSARSGITRNFAYASGPAFGLILDAAMPGWHRRMDDAADLGDLLAEAFGVVESEDLASSAEVRMARYDGAEVLAFEEAREAKYLEEQAEYRETFVAGLVLRLPVDEHFGYSFNPNRVSNLEGVGQVLGTAEVRAGWGTLNVSGGVLLERGPRGITGVVVPTSVGDEAPRSGTGWSLTLSEGWEIVPGERGGDWVVRPVGGGG